MLYVSGSGGGPGACDGVGDGEAAAVGPGECAGARDGEGFADGAVVGLASIRLAAKVAA